MKKSKKVVSNSVKEGKSLYYIDVNILKEIESNVIFIHMFVTSAKSDPPMLKRLYTNWRKNQ